MKTEQDFKDFCRSHRILYRIDEDQSPIAHSRLKRWLRVQAAFHGPERICVWIMSDTPRPARFWARKTLSCTEGSEIYQWGDTEISLLIPASEFLSFARGHGMVRRSMTEAQRAVLDKARAKSSLGI